MPSPEHTELIEGKIIDHSLAQRTSESILQARILMNQLIRGDDESKRLLLDYFREGIEEKYLGASSRTDQTRLENLKKQVALVNDGLSLLLGKNTTIVQMYRGVSEANPDEYHPVFTEKGQFNPQGFFDLLGFHKELATRILSTAEIASEAAEIEAQTAIIPVREELDRLKIREQQQTAIELVGAGPDLVEAQIVKGEIRTSAIRGWSIPLIIAIAETPMIFFQAPLERLSRWMDQAKDKAVPITAVAGAVAGPVVLFTQIATSSPIIESWLSEHVVAGTIGGIFGGALLSVAAWGAVRNIPPALKGAFNYIVDRLKRK